MNTIIWRILSVFEAILDTILPLRARAARTKKRTLEEIRLCPTPHDLLGTTITTLMDYKNSEVQDLIQSLKYDKTKHAAELCAEALADYLREELGQERTFGAKNIFLIPIPLHASRARERGYNQIGIVLDRLPKEFRDGSLATLAPTLLARTRETKAQTRLSRHERLSNVAGAFELSEGSSVENTHIYLIDDVTTTGATIAEAAKALQKSGAEVTALALAHA